MAGASLMIIDEPSLGLAPIVIDEVYTAIVAMKAAGTSVLLVEEIPNELLRWPIISILLTTGRSLGRAPRRSCLAAKRYCTRTWECKPVGQ